MCARAIILGRARGERERWRWSFFIGRYSVALSLLCILDHTHTHTKKKKKKKYPTQKKGGKKSFQPSGTAPSISLWKTLNKLMTIDGWLILHQQQLIGDSIKWPIAALNIQAREERRGEERRGEERRGEEKRREERRAIWREGLLHNILAAWGEEPNRWWIKGRSHSQQCERLQFMARTVPSNSRAVASLKADTWRKCTVKIFYSQVPRRSSDSPWPH